MVFKMLRFQPLLILMALDLATPLYAEEPWPLTIDSAAFFDGYCGLDFDNLTFLTRPCATQSYFDWQAAVKFSMT